MASNGSHNTRATAAARTITDRFLTAVHEHVSANHDVAFYADYLRIHPDYLTRCVKAVLATSPKAVIQQELARRAQSLLRAGSPVAETAGALGFESPAYFSRFYRRVRGVTPSSEQKGRGTDPAYRPANE